MDSIVEHPLEVRSRNPLVRAAYFTLGTISLILLAFSFLPGIPTVDLVVLALFFFTPGHPHVSSAGSETALSCNAFLPGIRGLTRATKIQATVGIVGSLLLSAGVLTSNTTLRTVLGFVGLYALWFVWSRPAKSTD